MKRLLHDIQLHCSLSIRGCQRMAYTTTQFWQPQRSSSAQLLLKHLQPNFTSGRCE